MIETAEYCEELTRVRQVTSITRLSIFQMRHGKPSARIMHSVEGQMISQMETMSIHTLEVLPTIQSLWNIEHILRDCLEVFSGC